MTIPFPHPLVLGHRGAPQRAPENSLRAFALAMEAGADGVELDVQRSADGVPVVIHDPTLERTGHGAGAVASLSWREISRLSGDGEPIPSLEQAAAWAAAAGAWLNVELKAAGVEEATLAVLESAGMLETSLLSSFSAETMRELARLAPGARRFLLADEWHEGVQRAAAGAAVQGICLRVDAASPLALEVVRREGHEVVVWTVDDPELIRELFRSGVAGVITNRPELAHALPPPQRR